MFTLGDIVNKITPMKKLSNLRSRLQEELQKNRRISKLVINKPDVCEGKSDVKADYQEVFIDERTRVFHETTYLNFNSISFVYNYLGGQELFLINNRVSEKSYPYEATYKNSPIYTYDEFKSLLTLAINRLSAINEGKGVRDEPADDAFRVIIEVFDVAHNKDNFDDLILQSELAESEQASLLEVELLTEIDDELENLRETEQKYSDLSKDYQNKKESVEIAVAKLPVCERIEKIKESIKKLNARLEKEEDLLAKREAEIKNKLNYYDSLYVLKEQKRLLKEKQDAIRARMEKRLAKEPRIIVDNTIFKYVDDFLRVKRY